MFHKTRVVSETPVSQTKKQYIIGLEVGYAEDIQEKTNQVLNISFQLICANPRKLTTNFSSFKSLTEDPSDPVFSWDCLRVSQDGNVRTSGLVGVLSNYVDEVKNDVLSQRGEKILLEELRFCKYFGVPAIVIDLHETGIPQIASLLLSMTLVDAKNCKPYIWVRFKLGVERDPLEESESTQTNERKSGQYKLWEKLIKLCDQDEHIFPVLELTSSIPSDFEVESWIRDKVTAIFIPTGLFSARNGHGHPVLSPCHVQLIQKFIAGRTNHYFIKDTDTKTKTPDLLLRCYRRNIEVIWKTWDESQREIGTRQTQTFSLPVAPGSLISENYHQPRSVNPTSTVSNEPKKGLVVPMENSTEGCDEIKDYSRFLNDDDEQIVTNSAVSISSELRTVDSKLRD